MKNNASVKGSQRVNQLTEHIRDWFQKTVVFCLFAVKQKCKINKNCFCVISNLALLVLQDSTHRKSFVRTSATYQTHLLWVRSSLQHSFSCGLGIDWLFLGTASCLDAFSAYPLQRSYPALPCQTTGTPVAAPPCSSRTRGSFPSVNQQLQQIVSKLARTVLNPTNVRL